MSNDTTMAAPELEAIDIKGVTRQSFIVRGALAAGAVYGASTVAPFVSGALAKDGGGDVGILNFALTLEYLEEAFYTKALKQVKGLSGEAKSLATTLRDNESAHVDALTTAIKGAGGKPVAAPKVDFGMAFGSEKSFLKLAQTFEDTGVSAYNGAGPSIRSKELLATAGSIVQIEARHAARIRLAREQPPAPDAFDKALGTKAVLKAVGPFVKS
jgi:Ferritin-like domain